MTDDVAAARWARVIALLLAAAEEPPPAAAGPSRETGGEPEANTRALERDDAVNRPQRA